MRRRVGEALGHLLRRDLPPAGSRGARQPRTPGRFTTIGAVPERRGDAPRVTTISTVTASRIDDTWSARTPYARGADWPVRVDELAHELDPIAQRYGGASEWATAVEHAGTGDLLSDLRVLRLRCDECALTWQMSVQAAKAARDQELLAVATACHVETEAHAKWFTTRIAAGAAQALVVG